MKGLANADYKEKMVTHHGYTHDIIDALLSQNDRAANQTKKIAPQFLRSDVKSTCEAIFLFVKQNINYKEDKPGKQDIRLPSRLVADKQGDCKSMSLFCASILQNLGIPYKYRFVSQSKNEDYHHVFIFVDTDEPVYLDCVEPRFNTQSNYARIMDYTPVSTTKKIAGIGATTSPFQTATGSAYSPTQAYEMALAINPNPWTWDNDERIYTKDFYPICTDHYFYKGYHIALPLGVRPGSFQWIDTYNACRAINPNIEQWHSDSRISDACKIGMQWAQWQLYQDAKTVATIDTVRYRDWCTYLKDWRTINLPIYERELVTFKKKLKEDTAWLIAGSILSAGMTAFDPNYGAFVKLLVQVGGLNQDGTGNFGVKGAFAQNTFEQLIYNYWDESKCPFPARLADKRKQARDLHYTFFQSRINRRYVQTGNIQPYFSEFNLELFCNIHCLNIYGMTKDMLLQKMYNYEKYGTEMLVPGVGTPFWDKKQNIWNMNGANQQDMQLLIYAMVADGKTNFRPYGIPFWTVSGYIMQNGADYKTLEAFKANVPMPAGLTVTTGIINPDPIKVEKSRAYYETKIQPYYSPIGYACDKSQQTNPFATNTTRPGVTGTARIGIAPAVIAAIISAVVSILTLILGIVAEELKKQKKTDAEVDRDKFNVHTDFPQNYTSADGCYIEQNATGNVKICPDGTVTKNVDLTAPENLPSVYGTQTSGAPTSKKTKGLLLFGGAALAVFFLIPSGTKAAIKGLFNK